MLPLAIALPWPWRHVRNGAAGLALRRSRGRQRARLWGIVLSTARPFRQDFFRQAKNHTDKSHNNQLFINKPLKSPKISRGKHLPQVDRRAQRAASSLFRAGPAPYPVREFPGARRCIAKFSCRSISPNLK